MAPLQVVAIGLGTVLAVYIALIVVIAHRFTTPLRMSPSLPSPKAGAPDLRTVRFSARDEALQLSAWYAATPGAKGAIILAHGRNACRGEELRGDSFELVAHFVRLGFSVLLVDLRGHGDSETSRLTFGRRERRDILGAVDFLLALGYASRSIGVLGASMGGVSAIGAAADEPAIGAIVTDSAFCTLHDVLRIQFVRLTRLPGWCLPGATMVASVLTGEQLRRHTAAHDMERLRDRPTLVIHAQHDPFVPVSHARALAHAGHAQLWITNGNRHLSSYSEERTEYARVVGGFFQAHLTPLLDPAVPAVRLRRSIPRERVRVSHDTRSYRARTICSDSELRATTTNESPVAARTTAMCLTSPSITSLVSATSVA